MFLDGKAEEANATLNELADELKGLSEIDLTKITDVAASILARLMPAVSLFGTGLRQWHDYQALEILRLMKDHGISELAAVGLVSALPNAIGQSISKRPQS